MLGDDPPTFLDRIITWAKNLFSSDSQTQSEAIQAGVDQIPGMKALEMVNKMARREKISTPERIAGNLDYALVAVVAVAPEVGITPKIESPVVDSGGGVGSSAEIITTETTPIPSRGASRAAQYSSQWENSSLKSTINRFAPESEGITVGQKTVYTNNETGVQVVYDRSGNYFRIQDTNVSGQRPYLDMGGSIPNNKVVNGKQMGRSQAEYNQVTHFNNLD